jgi:hypothetical protein
MDLPPDGYALFGSGPIAIRGLLDDIGDLDVIVTAQIWKRVRETGTVVLYGDHETVDLGKGLTFGRSWAYGHFDIEQLIGNSEVIDGLSFVRLSAVLEYKRIAERPKDLRHLELIAAAGLV